jgi:hypothetical protein
MCLDAIMAPKIIKTKQIHSAQQKGTKNSAHRKEEEERMRMSRGWHIEEIIFTQPRDFFRAVLRRSRALSTSVSYALRTQVHKSAHTHTHRDKFIARIHTRTRTHAHTHAHAHAHANAHEHAHTHTHTHTHAHEVNGARTQINFSLTRTSTRTRTRTLSLTHTNKCGTYFHPQEEGARALALASLLHCLQVLALFAFSCKIDE